MLHDSLRGPFSHVLVETQGTRHLLTFGEYVTARLPSGTLAALLRPDQVDAARAGIAGRAS